MENIAKQIGVEIVSIKSKFDITNRKPGISEIIDYIFNNTRGVIIDSDVPAGAGRWVSSRRTIGMAVRINWIKLIEENEKH